MNTMLVDIRNVTKQFEKEALPAVDSVSAVIPQGQILGLAGPDGAGKTTLIRLIAGLLKPTSGTITIDGYDTILDADKIHRVIGYMPQKFGLYEDLTVIQNLNLYADLRGVLGEERKKAFEKLLAFTDLTRFQQRLAGALSGGMKQKLGLACSLLSKPMLLLLDEPSVGVDPLSRRELWKMVQELVQEGITVLWSTAYLDEAERCSNVFLLNEGKLLYKGPPAELTQRVKDRVFKVKNVEGSRRAALFNALNEQNISDGVIQGADLRLVIKKIEPDPINIPELHAGTKIKIVQTLPRFEDAFIDILGGGPGGISVLAERTPEVKTKSDAVVQAEHLTKKFGDFTAADDITFKIPSGEIFGLLGPNGAGKTTTFKMMCGLLQPTSGKAFVNGLDLEQAPGEARAHVGYMAQKFSLYGNLSVLQNLNFFSGIYNMKGRKRKIAVDEMVEIFGFKNYLNENAETLPLGFKQRLALSCSVMHHPEVLFLDEPTSGVDPITRREFWNHINGLVEKGVTVMVTTHFMDEAEYCDRIGLVYRGKMIKLGTPDELKLQAVNQENQTPTLEDAFIHLIKIYDQENPNG